MLSYTVLNEVRTTLQIACRRNYGVTSVLLQKATDPIQQLFADKVKEYAQKKKASGGKLVDATPQNEKELEQELGKVARQYGGGPGVDMTQFPSFKFSEPTIDGQVPV